MTATTMVTQETNDALGRTMLRLVSFPIGASDIRKWAAAVHWPEPPPARYLTEATAELVAPLDFNPFAWASAESEPAHAATIDFDDPERIEKLLGVPGPGVHTTLHGGMNVEYHAPMHVGDVITSVAKPTGYAERDGRLGRMLLTTVDEIWTNQNGRLVKTVSSTLIRY